MITNFPGNLFDQIVKRLTLKVPELRFIDQDLGQLEHYSNQPAVSWPCALVDIKEFNFTDIGNDHLQLGTGLIQIRVAHTPYSPSNSLAPQDVREKAVGYYALEQKVFKSLHGWQEIGFSKLLRRYERTESRNDNIRVRAIGYFTSYTDDSAKPIKTTVHRPGANISTNS